MTLADAQAQADALIADARGHKRALGYHRRALARTREELRRLEDACRRAGIQITTFPLTGEGSDSHGRSDIRP